MNKRLTRFLAALSALAVWGLLGPVGCDRNSGQPPETAQPTEQSGAQQAAEPAAEKAADESAPEKKPDPITGAFGLTLGEHFEPAMVSEVLGEEESSYMKADRSLGKGTLFRIVPKAPDEHYNAYSVATNDEGLIYKIEGAFAAADNASTCDQARSLVEKLRAKHGGAIGMDIDSTSFVFDDKGQNPGRTVTVSSNRCHVGHYRVTYYDHSVLNAETDAAATVEKAAEAKSEVAPEPAVQNAARDVTEPANATETAPSEEKVPPAKE